MKELTQEIFNGQPQEVDWCGVDYDGKLSFGKAINPRYTHSSERWRGFDLVGDTIVDSGYKPLTSIRRDDVLSEEEIFNLSGEELDAVLRKQGYNPRKLEEDAKNLLKRLIKKAEIDLITPESLEELGFEKDKIVDVWWIKVSDMYSMTADSKGVYLNGHRVPNCHNLTDLKHLIRILGV